MIKRREFNGLAPVNYSWYDVTDIDESDTRSLRKLFKLTPDIISYVSDRHERPHYDFDEHTHSHLLVYDVPLWPSEAITHFTAHPITFLIQGTTVFTFHTSETSYIFNQFDNRTTRQRLKDVNTVTEFVMLFLLHSSQYFQRALTQINNERNTLDAKLSNNINNDDLVELSNVEKSLVYLSSSIKTNLLMLNGLNSTPIAAHFSKLAQERLDDVLIESNQSSQMVEISTQVTRMLSSTSNNMMNNNLNDTMKFLTVWSLVLTIPTIMTGFYGMNVRLPFMDQPLAWIIVSIITIGLMIWLVIYMKKNHFF